MARSLLGSFVSGTRQMLTLQLFVSVGAVALAGYTVGVTNNVIRERDNLREHVRQLEIKLADAGITPPPLDASPVQEAEAPASYPQQAEEEIVVAEAGEEAVETPAPPPPPPSPPIEEPAAQQPPREEPPAPIVDHTIQPPRGEVLPPPPPPPQQTAEPREPALDAAAQVLIDLLTPPPALTSVVLHVQRADYDEAQRIASQLAGGNLRISIAIRGPNDQAGAGYAYYHGRQSRPAADVARRIQEAARGAEIAAWAVQLRGTALPAQGEYTADRLDVTLPALPQAQPPSFNPNALRANPNVVNRAVVQQPQPDPNAPR